MATTRETINLGTLAVVVTRETSNHGAEGDITVKVESQERDLPDIVIERYYRWTYGEWRTSMRASSQSMTLDDAAKYATMHAMALEIMRDLTTNLPPKPVEE